MRDIKFRAKRKDIEDPLERWIEGSYVEFRDIKDNKIIGIISPSGYRNEIDKKTIGQFTGVYDYNGKEIWEGDIVNVHLNNHNIIKGCYVYYSEGGFRLKDNGKYAPYFGNLTYLTANGIHTEVIGNIYDNPDLLKENNLKIFSDGK